MQGEMFLDFVTNKTTYSGTQV